LDENADLSASYYTFRICPAAATTSSGSTECYDGVYSAVANPTISSVAVTPDCSAYDTYIINIMEYSTSTMQATGTTSGNLICMYVRREIRDLSAGDLGKTMDAMWTMWSVTEEEGRSVYGDDYHSSTYLLEYHFFNAGWQDADHIHEGIGFLAQHIKMSNIFELAMQSIDPSVSLPYWDFTIESATNTSIMFSPIFTDELFGSMPQPADAYWGWTYESSTMRDAAVPNGRWAYVEAEKNTKFDDLNYGYGYLRAPWNMNPSPYLSRFTSTNKHLPSCSSHYELLGYDTLNDFLATVPYGAHAATHGTIGGVYGCDAMNDLAAAGYIIDDEAQINLCKNWIFYLKEFYRMNYLTPYTNCTMTDGNTDFDSLNCGFTCNPDDADRMLFDLTKILNSDYDCVPTDMDDAGWYAWRDFICTGDGFKVFGGDHLESASPADPSFWPIHPTLERLLQAKYMSGGFQEDASWASDPVNDYVCDKSNCYDEDKGGYGYWTSCCYGHYEDDQLLDAPNANKSAGTGMTNSAVHKGTDPSGTYAMNYIYDDFDWTHCELVGLDFVELLEEKYTTAYASGWDPSSSSEETKSEKVSHDVPSDWETGSTTSLSTAATTVSSASGITTSGPRGSKSSKKESKKEEKKSSKKSSSKKSSSKKSSSKKSSKSKSSARGSSKSEKSFDDLTSAVDRKNNEKRR